MSYTPIQLLENWILRQASDAGQAWLDTQREAVATGDLKALYMSFGFAPRKIGKADLQLTERDLNDAAEARPGWKPNTWTLDQAARVLLLMSLPAEDDAAYFATVEKLFQTAEIREQICLYQALQLLPHQVPSSTPSVVGCDGRSTDCPKASARTSRPSSSRSPITTHYRWS